MSVISSYQNHAANDISDIGELLQLSSRAHYSRSTPNNSDPPPFISSLKLNRADSATMELLQKAEQVRAIHHHLKQQDYFTHLPRKPVQVLPKLFLKNTLSENLNFHHPRIASDRQPTPTNCIKVYKNYIPGQQDPVVPSQELRARSRHNRSREISTRGGDIDHSLLRSQHEKSRTVEFPSMTADNNSFQLNNSISTPSRKYRNRMHTVNHIFLNPILKPTNKTLENEDARCRTSETQTQNQLLTNEQEGLNEILSSYRSRRHSSRTPSLLVLPPHLVADSARAFSPEQQDNLPVNRKSTTPLRSSRISLTTIQAQLLTPGRASSDINLPFKRVQSETQFSAEQPEKISKTIAPSNDSNYVNIMSLLKSRENIGSRHAHSGSLSINTGKSIAMSLEDLGQKEMKKQVSVSHTRQISEVNTKPIEVVSSPDIDGVKRNIRSKSKLKFRNQEAVVDRLFNTTRITS